MKPRFFRSPAEFRSWLQAHHASAKECVVGYWKTATGKPTLTWSESVDEALCFGWIDGKRWSLGAESYAIRFTPRKPSSNWSAINVRKVKTLVRARKMRPAGLRAFAARLAKKTAVYSFEQRNAATLPPAFRRKLAANRKALSYFEAKAPWYRRAVAHWITSAKRTETRASRLDTLIACSARGEDVPPLRVRQRSR